jgi:hypothetical protein
MKSLKGKIVERCSFGEMADQGVEPYVTHQQRQSGDRRTHNGCVVRLGCELCFSIFGWTEGLLVTCNNKPA